MKLFNTIIAVIMLLLSTNVAADALDRNANCASNDNDTGFKNCPHCGPGKGFSDNHNPIKPIPVLHTCGDKNLDRIECVHQCKCDNGELKCREWNSCRGSTVTNYCKCKYNGESCEKGTLNKKTDDGGVCFCPDHDTVGMPPQL